MQINKVLLIVQKYNIRIFLTQETSIYNKFIINIKQNYTQHYSR